MQSVIKTTKAHIEHNQKCDDDINDVFENYHLAEQNFTEDQIRRIKLAMKQIRWVGVCQELDRLEND